MKKFFLGNIKNDTILGWITGQFFPQDRPQHDKNIEIKVSKVDKKFKMEKHYHPIGRDWIIVIQGGLTVNIDGENLAMKGGDYLIIESNTTEEVISAEDNTIVVTIRTPSLPNNKIIAD